MDLQKNKRVPEKQWLLLFDYAKAFDCVDHNKLWKIVKETTWPASVETYMQVRRQQLELDMEQHTGFKY